MSTEQIDPARPVAASIRKSIVVGIDGSQSSKHALRWADFLARTTGCTLQATAAWQPYSAYGWGGYGLAIPAEWNPEGDARKGVVETIDEVFGAHRPADLEIVIHQGTAAQVLLDISSDAQMLVVGSRGHGGFTGLLLGSVSSACAEHATCPVFVVHGTTPPPSL